MADTKNFPADTNPLGQLSFTNEVFSNFAFYSGVVLLKMLLIGWYTVVVRFRTNIFANPEDYSPSAKPEKKKPIFNNEDVERTRRNHLNDLENIPAFIFAGLLYVLAGPDPWYALWHFRAYAITRIVHTLSYQIGVQPWRALTHGICQAITISMIVQAMMVAKY